MVKKGKPYRNLIITSLLHSVYFQSKNSIGSANPEEFINSIEGRDPDKVEICPSMLALFATSVRSMLREPLLTYLTIFLIGSHVHFPMV